MRLYSRNAGVEAAPLQQETVLFNPATKNFSVLNETAAFIWGMLDGPRAVAEISTNLCAEFDGVDFENASEDVLQVLEHLVELELVNVD